MVEYPLALLRKITGIFQADAKSFFLASYFQFVLQRSDDKQLLLMIEAFLLDAKIRQVFENRAFQRQSSGCPPVPHQSRVPILHRVVSLSMAVRWLRSFQTLFVLSVN